MTGAEKRPLRRDAEENRLRLLAAAGEVFAESGFEVTMDEIAAHAGVGVGTAYRRFANKEELIGALFEDRVGQLVDVAERALAERDPWRGVVSFLEGSIELHACDRGLKELIFSSPHGRAYVEAARDRIKPLVEQVVARANRAGVLRPGVEPTDLVMVQMMFSSLTDLARDQDRELWRRYLPLALDGLSAERTAPLPGEPLTTEQLEAAMESPGPGSR